MMRRGLILPGLVLVLSGCASDGSTVDRAPEANAAPPAQVSEAAPDPIEPVGPDVASNGGRYRVEWRTEPSPIPLNEPFTLVARVRDGSTIVMDPIISIDARMPHHRHGMTRVPIVSHHDDGEFRARGMLFHMPGDWQMYVDVTDGVVTERAQINVVLD